MSWLGSLLGGSIGLGLGGPLGGLLGAFIGQKIQNMSRQAGSAGADPAMQQKLWFMTCLFALLAKMAKADGQVSEAELALVRSLMQQMRLDQEDQIAAMRMFTTAKDDPHSFDDYAHQYAQIASPEMCRMLYRVLHDLAHADGHLHPAEEAILQRLPQLLNIAPEHEPTAAPNKAQELAMAYQTLECKPEQSDQEIKRAYQQAAAKFHPDRLASKGLPEELMTYATEQMQKINAAYDTIQKSRA